MDKGASRYFASVIHEFTQSIGKENFYLIAEITGDRKNAFTTLEETGMNAALGIADIPGKIEWTVKGYADPIGYFDLFRNSELVQKESHVWFRDKVVTLFDDHDQVRNGKQKARFCAKNKDWQKLVVNAIAFNVLTMGIPCIYYGTEQCFDGEGGNDRYIREAMFSGEFGAFRSKNHHFFNEQSPSYKEISKIIKIRKQELPLRRGRQYLRKISGNGSDFGFPRPIGERMLSVLPWSRIFSDTEILCAINTDPDNTRSAWVVIDKDLHEIGDSLTCLYSSDQNQIGFKMK
jgi:glycosidase